MIHYPHFKEVTTDTLKQLGLYSERATMAIAMIVAHESDKGKYLKQIGGGPALGVIQMEPETHYNVWKHCDNIKHYADILGIDHCQLSLSSTQQKINSASPLIYDLRYNVFMARMMLIMDPNPLPYDAYSMSRYLKRCWNTHLGAATSDDYYNAWSSWTGLSSIGGKWS